MKKIFTLISMAIVAMSANAQDVYNAIVDGKLAPAFAAVAGANGGVANNAADGKSIVTFSAGKATCTAVGGTTPHNADGGGQQITPGAVIDADKHIYEVASVEAWNDITWGLKNQGDIDFWYVTGTGNPYVKMNAVENSKDGEWQGNYKADYVFYEPDGSLGLPITGLYYKFTATAAGAFKVKVWANKGNRKTFVVNAATMKAERLLASGYINGVNDESGKKKLLTVDEVDAEHHKYIYGNYEAELAKYEAGESSKTAEELAQMKEDADAMAVERYYVIGNGNQNFWGWLTFDVEPGEEYWVFQHSSQIGFGGFEFYEGMTAEEVIQGIEPPYVYTTNFSTYEDEETGDRVPWKGESAVGNGKFASTEEEGAVFGDFFENDGTAARTSYCLLPEDVLAHSANTEALTIAVWVQLPEGIDNPDDAPLFAAYTAADSYAAPLFGLQAKGKVQLNDNVYAPAVDLGNWLADNKWHFFTATFDKDNAKLFVDGTQKQEWTGVDQTGLFANELKYVCLGGNGLEGNDSPYRYARLLIKNSAMSAGEIDSQIRADVPNWDEYMPSGVEAVKMNNTVANGAIYNLAGQRVNKDYKGLMIQNGKKVVMK